MKNRLGLQILLPFVIKTSISFFLEFTKSFSFSLSLLPPSLFFTFQLAHFPLPISSFFSAEAEMYLTVSEGRAVNYNLKGSPDLRKELVFNALLKQKVDIVLTAHPTEVQYITDTSAS